jgi:hypothetical protein
MEVYQFGKQLNRLKVVLHTKQWLGMWPTKPKRTGSNQNTKTPKSETVLLRCKRQLQCERLARPEVLDIPTK